MRMFTVCTLSLVAAPLLAAGTLITGAGATFPYPLYARWFSDYGKARAEVQFNYQSIGSGGGIQQVTRGTVDFGATDAPMTDDELTRAPGILHVPTVLGAVAVVHNTPVKDLRLSGAVLASIFLGTVTRWNDPAIAALNPGTALPSSAITVAHRADGSGTTAIFTDYLARVSPEWLKSVGRGKAVKWPTGLGGKGNDGVTALVKQAPGAIGYVELAYANQNALPVVALQNRAGVFVRPTLASTTAAAAGVTLPGDFRVSITDADGKDAYPVAAFTYLLIHADNPDTAKGTALARFLWWAIHDGQKVAPSLDYAPLPAPVVARVEERIRQLKAGGKAVVLEP
ncbi:MAG: phosphate ABC transporter substrate-binding protein PstS [Deltaproteobacteria bacterium]|nr:phosphate ABC transporter substrate-binding protein PstS [Deltaproteobacteria bacterium]